MAKRMPDTDERHAASALSHLRHPLVFYGLALLVTETAFGGALALRVQSQGVTILIVSLMAFLFVASIAAVTFLTYVRPDNIMLEPQDRLRASSGEAHAHREKLSKARETIRKLMQNPPEDASRLRMWLSTLDLILEDLPEGRQEGQR